MAVSSAEEFFAVLEKSKLLTPAQLAEARGVAEGTGSGTEAISDPKAIARELVRLELITRWQAGQLLAGRSTFYLGKYRLIERLGRGGMGNVFLAEHVTMNRRVALKTISSRLSKDQASLDRFLAEARAIASLDHENIVRAYNVDCENDRYYLVMEFVEGVDLERAVDEGGPQDFDVASDYIRQAADGLDHAHQRNMVHCDIKPSNLLVNGQGVVKILDLGLARLSGDAESSDPSRKSGVLGSVDYLAPEQAMESPDLDCRADIYSLGCTLYFLLTGHPPFPTGSLMERIVKHQTQEPVEIRKDRPDVPPVLTDICRKMMAKRPEDRYQTAAEVSRALAEWRTSKPAAPLKRAVALPKAKPIAEMKDDEFFGMDFNAELKDLPAMQSDAALGQPPGMMPVAARKKSSGTNPVLIAAIAAGAVVLFGIIILLVFLANSGPTARTTVNVKPTPSEAAATAKENAPSQKAATTPTPTAAQPPKTEAAKDSQATPPKTPAVKPKPKKTKPKPSPKTPPKAPPQVVMVMELPEAIDLPPIKSGKEGETSLGRVVLPTGAALSMKLVGGDKIFKSKQIFQLANDGPTAWKIVWRTAVEGLSSAMQSDVARIWLDGDQLRFGWLSIASDVPADRLRNCGLTFHASRTTRFVALRHAQSVEPLSVDFDRRGASVDLSSDTLPDADVMRLEITGFSEGFPNCTIQPGDPIALRKKVEIGFQDRKMARIMLRIGFDSRTAKDLRIELVGLCDLPGQSKFAPLNPNEAEQLLKKTMMSQAKMQAAVASLGAKNPNRQALQQKLEQQNAAIEQLKALAALYQSFNKKARMHYRVFNDFGDHQVTLFATPPGSVKPVFSDVPVEK